jgi:hypothetical protein
MDKEWILDLAALDQLEASLEDHSDSKYAHLIARYCELQKRAIQLKKDMRAGLVSADRCVTEVWPLVERINEVLNQIHVMAGDKEEYDDADWWKHGNDS